MVLCIIIQTSMFGGTEDANNVSHRLGSFNAFIRYINDIAIYVFMSIRCEWSVTGTKTY